MKRLVFFFCAILLAMCVLFLLTADFRVARSATQTNTSWSDSNSYNPNAKTETNTRRIFLHVEDRINLANAIALEVLTGLRATGTFDVVLLNNKPDVEDYPLLLIGLRDKRSLWTPFYGRANFRVLVDYASYTSDISLDKKGPIHFDGNGKSCSSRSR